MADACAESPVRLLSTVAHQWHCDHLGHLNVRNYAAIFDDAIFVFWNRFGVGRDDRIVPVTAELKISFQREAAAGMVADVRYRVTRIGSKSVGMTFEMTDASGGETLASCEVIEVFFSSESRTRARPEIDESIVM
ncbi:MAG: thioesterase family protein [Rhizobiales bacterium]|nr:thioesterase family protein [Hyphomicrobiales bacterium]